MWFLISEQPLYCQLPFQRQNISDCNRSYMCIAFYYTHLRLCSKWEISQFLKAVCHYTLLTQPTPPHYFTNIQIYTILQRATLICLLLRLPGQVSILYGHPLWDFSLFLSACWCWTWFVSAYCLPWLSIFFHQTNPDTQIRSARSCRHRWVASLQTLTMSMPQLQFSKHHNKPITCLSAH